MRPLGHAQQSRGHVAAELQRYVAPTPERVGVASLEKGVSWGGGEGRMDAFSERIK